MNRRILIPVFFLAAVLTSCRHPTFEWVDLREVAYQAGDLPADASLPEIVAVDGKKAWKYLQWIKVRLRGMDHETVFDADVILFADRRELLRAFDDFTASEGRKGYEEYTPPEIGYGQIGWKQNGPGASYVINVSFQRCYAMVNIWARVDSESVLSEDDVYAYAAALDQRLNLSVCPI
jgi:hypothetical protein